MLPYGRKATWESWFPNRARRLRKERVDELRRALGVLAKAESAFEEFDTDDFSGWIERRNLPWFQDARADLPPVGAQIFRIGLGAETYLILGIHLVLALRAAQPKTGTEAIGVIERVVNEAREDGLSWEGRRVSFGDASVSQLRLASLYLMRSAGGRAWHMILVESGSLSPDLGAVIAEAIPGYERHQRGQFEEE